MRFFIGVLAGWLALSVAAPAATRIVWRTDKPDDIARLNDDLRQAMQGATLNAKQRKQLENSNLALQRAVDAHTEGKSFDTQAVVKACKNIETMNKADVFSANDKKTIQRDLGRSEGPDLPTTGPATQEPLRFPALVAKRARKGRKEAKDAKRTQRSFCVLCLFATFARPFL